MVVTDSREAAVRYKQAFDKIIAQKHIDGLKALVAFTGGVKLKEDELVEYTETKMNGFPEKKTKDAFNTTEYQILLVANKYQTGYDQPLLVAMYVDKQLKGAAAVQTLGRLNRTYPGKTEVFVLDFKNKYEDIKAAFAPYYTETELVGETDPNKLYDLERFIDSFNLVTPTEIEEFIAIAIKNKRSDDDVSKWNHLLGLAKTRYDAIPEEENQYKVRKDIIKLVEGYSLILQVADFEDVELHKKTVFFKFFAKYLRTGDGERIDASKLVEFEKFKQKKTREGSEGGNPIDPKTKQKVGQFTKAKEKEEDENIHIEEFIKLLNDIYGAGLDPKTYTPVIQLLINLLLANPEVVMKAKNNTEKDLQLYINKALEDVLVDGQDINQDFSDKILENVDMKNKLAELLTAIVHQEANK